MKLCGSDGKSVENNKGHSPTIKRGSVPDCHGETTIRTFRVNRKDIWYLHFIFEAYDGVATVSTIDSREGIVILRIPSSRVEEAQQLLGALCQEISLEELASASPPEFPAGGRGREPG